MPTLHTVYCVLVREHLVGNKLSGELDGALRVCIKSINEIKAHPLNS